MYSINALGAVCNMQYPELAAECRSCTVEGLIRALVRYAPLWCMLLMMMMMMQY